MHSFLKTASLISSHQILWQLYQYLAIHVPFLSYFKMVIKKYINIFSSLLADTSFTTVIMCLNMNVKHHFMLTISSKVLNSCKH